MIVAGRVIDENGRPVVGTLVEIWQANSAGRYFHPRDSRDAPLDPNFTGGGRTITDEEGRYRFITVKPGYYPWENHPNAWRPAHIHFSVFGPSFVTRLICQMYFEDDPMLPFDPIYMSVPSEAGRKQLLARFDYELTVAGLRSRLSFRHRAARPRRHACSRRMTMPIESGWATVGPFFHAVLPWKDAGEMAKTRDQGRAHHHHRARARCARKSRSDDAMIELWQANAAGKYNHPEDTQPGEIDPSFQGFGRVTADARRLFHGEDHQAGAGARPRQQLGKRPHIEISIFARGVLKRLVTRLYFEGDPANRARPRARA